MSVEAARLHVTVTSDTDHARRGLLGLGSDVDDTGGRFGRVVGSMAAIGATAFVAIGAAAIGAGVALARGFAEAVGAATDLGETVNKANVVFGDSAKIVTDFGETSARAFGVSKNEAVGAAATFGNLFRAIGIGQAPAADMSTSLVKLAADLASFNNMDPTEVLEKLRSGLSGEVEPLRSVGVFLNEATVKAKAMEMGLADANGELSEAAKVQARYALILEQTSLAQGDFGRTSTSLANQQRILKAQWQDLLTVVGRELTPALERAAQSITSSLMPGLQRLAPSIGALAAPLGELAAKAADAFGRWVSEPGRVEGIIERIRGAMDGLVGSVNNMRTGFADADGSGDGLLDSFRRMIEVVGPLAAAHGHLAATILEKLGPSIPPLVDALARLVETLVGTKDNTGPLIDALNILTSVVEKVPGPVLLAAIALFSLGGALRSIGTLITSIALVKLVGTLAAAGAQAGYVSTRFATFATVLARLSQPFGLLRTAIIGMFSTTGAMIGVVAASVVQLVVGVQAVYSVFQQAGGVFQRFATISVGLNAVLHGQGITFAQMSQQIQGALGGVGASMGWVTGTISSATAQWSAIVQGMQATFVGIITGTVSSVVSVFSGLPGAVAGILSSAVNTWATIVQQLQGHVANAVGAAVNAAMNMAGRFVEAGIAMGQGMLRGISNMAGAVIAAAQNLANAARNAIMSALSIGSPSKVTMEFGRMMGAGLAGGMDAMQRTVARAGTSLANAGVVGVGGRGGGVPQVARRGRAGASSRPEVIQLVVDSHVLAEVVRNRTVRSRHHGRGAFA